MRGHCILGIIWYLDTDTSGLINLAYIHFNIEEVKQDTYIPNVFILYEYSILNWKIKRVGKLTIIQKNVYSK